MEDEYKVFAVDIKCICSKRIFVRALDQDDVERYIDNNDCRIDRCADISDLYNEGYSVDSFDTAHIEEADPSEYLLCDVEDLEEEEEEEGEDE